MLPLVLLALLTGCLKDKDFDNYKYGLTSQSSRAIGFIAAPSSPIVIGITGQPGTVTVAGPLITINGTAQAASAKTTIVLEEDASLVTAANLTPLPPGTYSINTKNPSIEPGDSLNSGLRISVDNSDLLDPNITYGVGYRIQSVDQGFGISKNMSTIVIGFAIKNKYDGVYMLRGYHNRVPYTFPYETEMELRTVAPNAVAFFFVDQNSYGHPIGVGANNSLSWYGADIAPVIEFDLTSNLVTNVYNGSAATPITMFTGAGSRVGKFNPADRSIIVDWNYNGNPLRAFFDDLEFLRDRD